MPTNTKTIKHIRTICNLLLLIKLKTNKPTRVIIIDTCIPLRERTCDIPSLAKSLSMAGSRLERLPRKRAEKTG